MTDLSQDAPARAAEPPAPAALRLRKMVVAAVSLVTSVVLSLGKLAIGLLSGSLALVADALQGLVDIVITAVTLWVVSESDRGSDPRWPAGRHKLEALAALAEAVLLTIIAICIWYLALQKLVFGTGAISVEPWFIGAVLLAVGADWWRGVVIRRAARETGSLALAANGAHFLTDAVASLAVVAGLVLAYRGWPLADTLATLVVAALLLVTAARVGWRACDMLLERSDPAASLRLLEAVEATPGVVSVEVLRLAPMPLGWRVDIGATARLQGLEALAALERRLQALVRAELGQAEVLVALRPALPGAESPPRDTTPGKIDDR